MSRSLHCSSRLTGSHWRSPAWNTPPRFRQSCNHPWPVASVAQPPAKVTVFRRYRRSSIIAIRRLCGCGPYRGGNSGPLDPRNHHRRGHSDTCQRPRSAHGVARPASRSQFRYGKITNHGRCSFFAVRCDLWRIAYLASGQSCRSPRPHPCHRHCRPHRRCNLRTRPHTGAHRRVRRGDSQQCPFAAGPLGLIFAL
jgi:hypothetical protein